MQLANIIPWNLSLKSGDGLWPVGGHHKVA